MDKPQYKIIRAHPSITDLERAVNADADYEAIGNPFYHADSREWCQSMNLRRVPTDPAEVRLREPNRKVR